MNMWNLFKIGDYVGDYELFLQKNSIVKVPLGSK